MENTDSVKRSALIVAVVGSFITPFIGSSINVALPAIGEMFGLDAFVLSWIATSYLLAAGVALVPFGKTADIYGRKRVLFWGFVIFTVSSLFCGVSVNGLTLIAARVIQGLGCGMVFATSTAILVSVYPPKERGRVLGITVSSIYIGLSSGPFIGGFLTMHFTWRSLFFVNGLLGVAVVGLIFTTLKGEWIEAKGERLDYLGVLIYGLTLVAIIYGLSVLPSYRALWLLGGGLIGLFVFIRWENRVPHPVFDIGLFRDNRVFALSNLAALIHYSATFAVTFLLSLYLQYVKTLDPQMTGLVLMAQPVMMAAFSPVAGKLSDRIEPRIMASLGMAITGFMIFLLSSVASDTSLLFIIACLLVLGFGYALFSSPNMNAIMGAVDKRFLGVASGAAGTMRVLGQMFSMGIATLVISVLIGRAQLSPEIVPSLIQTIRVTLLIFTVLCLGGVFASLARGNVRGSNRALV